MKTLNEVLDLSRRALDCARSEGQLPSDIELICEAVIDEIDQYCKGNNIDIKNKATQ